MKNNEITVVAVDDDYYEGSIMSGNKNTGVYNSGDWNTGDFNSGDNNSGDNNNGSWNSGDRNDGNWNSGGWNTGSFNTGHHNNGERNSGHYNSGCFNTGNWNKGGDNTGRHNTGNNNSGDWNSGDWSNGCFCESKDPYIPFFDQPSTWKRSEWAGSLQRTILFSAPKSIEWVSTFEMGVSERKEHPEYITMGGYLKEYTPEENKERMQTWWDNLSKWDKNCIFELPNFDAEKFGRIMGGIEV